MTLGVRAHDSAILRAANWIRSNSYSGMFRSRPLKDTWAANRGFYTPSTTRWELNRRVSADCDELLAKGAEKAAPWRLGRSNPRRGGPTSESTIQTLATVEAEETSRT